ncbi:MAG: hypothetical protein ABIQ18_05620 [Umezawaea sp.]
MGELVGENEESARLGLVEVSADRAPSMLRAFTHAVDAGARLWAALPPGSSPIGSPDLSGPDPMARLLEMAWAIQGDYWSGLWPGQGVADERLLNVAYNFNRAAALATASPPADQVENSPGMGEGLRKQVMRTLYVEAHGLRVALGLYAGDVSAQLERDSLRRTPLELRPHSGEPKAALAIADRLDLFERLAGGYLQDTRKQAPAASGDGPTSRLSTALAGWDIQAHRSLAAAPNASNVACVGRVQALITTTAGVVAEAAAVSGHLEPAAFNRFAPVGEASQVAWTRTANRWSELITPAGRTDPPLLGAASELRAALAAAVQGERGWAAPDAIAGRVDLPATLQTLNLALAGGIEVGHVVRGVAMTEPTLTAPARIIGMRTQSEVERDVDRGGCRFLGVEWVTARQVRDNQLIPLPDPARRGLVDIADQTTVTATRALSAFVVPTVSSHEERRAAAPTTLSSHVAPSRAVSETPMLREPDR